MKVFTTIGAILKSLDPKEKIIVLAVFIISFLAYEKIRLSNKLDEATTLAKKTEQNLKAAQDSIRLVEDKAGHAEYDKLTFVVNNLNELKKQNAELAQEVADTKGKVLQIQKQGYEIVHDTVKLTTTGQVVDSVVYLNSGYDSVYSAGNYRHLAFQNTYNLKTLVATGKVVTDRIGFTAVTGLKQTDKGYEIFVKPQYPNMEVVALEGAVIDKNFFKQPKSKPALITVGIHVGWTPIVYDLHAKKGDINLNRIGAGVGLNFNLSRIFNK
jgi:hypothetical protein